MKKRFVAVFLSLSLVCSFCIAEADPNKMFEKYNEWREFYNRILRDFENIDKIFWDYESRDSFGSHEKHLKSLDKTKKRCIKYLIELLYPGL